jgi:two-component system sensor histidine kinase DesK
VTSTYIGSTHAVLVAAAILVPVISATIGPATPLTMTGLVIAGIITALGVLVLVSEHRPDARFATRWRAPGVSTSWGMILVLGSIALAAAGNGHDIAVTVFPLALSFRSLATGSFPGVPRAVRPPTRFTQALAGLGFWGGSLAVGASALVCYLAARLIRSVAGLDPEGLLPAVALAALVAFAVIGQDTVYALAREVDDLRSTESQRAVAQERQRFAGDLHDIQGQHLQLLAAEAQLVQRLIDAGRHDDARDHAARIGQAAAAAVEDMRNVVHGYRAVRTPDEAANAVRVLEAAGLSVDAVINPPATIPEDADRLIGLTIREGITNVLRHTHTRHCHLTVTEAVRENQAGTRILLTDAGPAATAPLTPGSGITELRHRYADAGGILTLAVDATAGSRLEGWLPLGDGEGPHA